MTLKYFKEFKSSTGKNYTIPKAIYYILKEAHNKVEHKFDAPIIITGSVGSGKSNLEFGLGGIWEEHFYNRVFSLDKIHFMAEEVTKETNKDNNFKHFIGFDEAIQGGSSRDGVTKIGNVLRKALITKRYKGHCIVACVDSLKELNDKIIERAMVWFHVHYTRNNNGSYRRGVVKIFNSQQALKVYEDLKTKKLFKTEEHYIWKKNPFKYNIMNYSEIWFDEESYNKKKTEQTNLLEKEKGYNWKEDKMKAFGLWCKGMQQVKIGKQLNLNTSTLANWAGDFKLLLPPQSK